MDIILDFAIKFITQFQSPALAFLIGGMLIAALGSKLQIPNAIYQFAVFMLLMRIGISGGMEIKDANLIDMLLPALMTIIIGVVIVVLAHFYFPELKVSKKKTALQRQACLARSAPQP